MTRPSDDHETAQTPQVGVRSAPRGFPLPILPLAAGREIFFASTRMDGRGRLADRSTVREMGWTPGTAVVFAVDGGVLSVVASERGRCAITAQGHLRVPAPVRHRWRVAPGDLLLVVVAHGRDGLLVYPAGQLAGLAAPGFVLAGGVG